MVTFFTNVPIWVFPLFIALVILGLRARKDRRVPIALICLLPFLGILTLRNIVAMSPPNWLWIIAASGYAGGIALGIRLQSGWVIERHAQFATVKGEWVTLSAMMIVFVAGFLNGFLSATTPELAQTALFLTGFTAITCLASGQFLGRAIETLRTPVTQVS